MTPDITFKSLTQIGLKFQYVTTKSFTFEYHICFKLATPCLITGLTASGGRADIRRSTGCDGGLAFSSMLQLERVYLSSVAVCPSKPVTCRCTAGPVIKLESAACSFQYPQWRMWLADSRCQRPAFGNALDCDTSFQFYCPTDPSWATRRPDGVDDIATLILRW